MANKTLDELISWLASQPVDATVRDGFGSPHSDRGDYSNVAFDPVPVTTFGEMLNHARSALDREFSGYKGGEYVMHGYVDALIGQYGSCGENITDTHFKYWEGQTHDQ